MVPLNTSQKYIRFAFAIILLLGLYLRFHQYLMGRSLWEDETHLALNFMEHGFLRLTKPLDYIQGAPILFLWVVKAFVKIFGYGEIAFRALPFISSIITLPLIYFITRQLTGNKITALIAFFIFSVNLSLIYFSSELKQYAVEVAVYLILIYLAIGKDNYIVRKRNFLLAVVGSLSIFLSSTAFIILFCIGCNFVYKWYQQKKISKNELKIFIPWAIAFLINFFLFIYDHPSTAQQRANFSFAFLPIDPLSHEFVDFLRKTIEETFFNLLLYISKDYGFSYILLFIFIIVIRHIIVKKQYTLFFFTCLPILLHLGLSAMKLYPFWYRLILYLVPCFIILMSYGTLLIAQFLKQKLHIIVATGAIIFCCYSFTKNSFRQFPLWYREIKPSLNYVNYSIPSSAHVYITDPVNAYTYYYKRGIAKNKIYRIVPWEIDLPEYYDMVIEEDTTYILFYSTFSQWGYGDVLKDLKEKGLIKRSFQHKGYAVSEILPAPKDSLLIKRIDPDYFEPAVFFGEENAVALWGGSITSKPFELKPGKYTISILSRGTSVNGEFPKSQLYINDELIGEFISNQKYDLVKFTIESKTDINSVIKILMLNDAATEKEDRNSFIKSINIYKDKPQVDH